MTQRSVAGVRHRKKRDHENEPVAHKPLNKI